MSPRTPTASNSPDAPSTPARPVALAEVAAAAGVSTSLVSRVLSDDPGVRARPETQARVRETAARLGYRPNRVAQALRRRRTGAIGLVVHDLTNPIHAAIISGAQHELGRQGHALLLSDAEQFDANPGAADEVVAPGRVDALLWHGSGEQYDDALIARAAARVPTLLVNSASRVGVPAVHLDDEAAAELAVRHLLELGHRDIGFLGGSAGSDLTARRETGFRRALAAGGVPVREDLLTYRAWDAGAGADGMTELLRRASPPTAVLAANVVVATGALAAARTCGVDVPGQVSLVAIHDAFFAALTDPGLTTVLLGLRELGEHAVVRVLELLDGPGGGPSPDLTTVLRSPAPELLVRGSTAAIGASA